MSLGILTPHNPRKTDGEVSLKEHNEMESDGVVLFNKIERNKLPTGAISNWKIFNIHHFSTTPVTIWKLFSVSNNEKTLICS